MPWIPRFILFFCFILVMGAGCFTRDKTYIEADVVPSTISPSKPTIEGSQASTGGYEATVTSNIDTQILVNSLPDDNAITGYVGTTPKETKNPVPNLDGTRTEYTSISKVYERIDGSESRIINVSLTDTRGLPVLTAFLDAYTEYTNESGYRKRLEESDILNAWITYHPPIETISSGGFGSITALYRNRFLIQIDGNAGVNEEDLKHAFKMIDLEGLN